MLLRKLESLLFTGKWYSMHDSDKESVLKLLIKTKKSNFNYEKRIFIWEEAFCQ